MCDISLIYLSEEGAQVICPTTGQAYKPVGGKWSTFGSQLVLSSLCPLCDTRLGTGAHYDPQHPQPHMHSLGGRRP